MYVKIGNTEYRSISKLQFEPEADVTGSSVPVNELWVSVRTNDDIEIGDKISLYDDLGTLWCRYWITYAEHEDRYTIRVHGQSTLMKLDTVTLEPKMYKNESVGVAIAEVLSVLGGQYTLGQEFLSKTVSGYAPKQSARVRLQWICMCIGAYLKDYFNDHLEILKIDDSEDVIIPASDTYWKPSVTYKDYVTAVRATYYSFRADVPSRTDTYVEVDGEYFIQTETQLTLVNNEVPGAALENVVEIDGVTLINQDNVSDVLSFLSKYYFKRTELDLSCINNAQYMPAQRVMCFTEQDTMYSGYINSCSFTFGMQAKSDMHITPTETRDSAKITINYMYAGNKVGIRMYQFPIDYSYEVDNPFIDVTFNGHRYVFRPKNKTTFGIVYPAGYELNTKTEYMDIALDYTNSDLYVVSVDEFSFKNGNVVIR